jgi:bacteriocin biosynthesis cyclodehydratase domain-containing protein
VRARRRGLSDGSRRAPARRQNGRAAPVDARAADAAVWRNSRAVARFAPNFSVYVLPPDVVCLYSEDRKFFLHGTLYCALAEAIGERGMSFRGLSRLLARDFPADKIDEALKRLLDRRHLVAQSPAASGTTAAYWASLGLSPETAAANLRKCPVRVRALDVQGARELGQALAGLGVRLAKRAAAAALTVTLVGDYLDGRLEQLNKRHLADRSRWLLVQPAGIFPLVGPVLRPGEGACWMCLAERMKRNREVRAFIDRSAARCVARSPLVAHAVGGSAVHLAALEIAKAIATDFRSELSDHIVSLDLLGSSVVKHYVPARPQCPACGRRSLRDPRRAPQPLALAAGGRLVMTSGGYRTVPSRDTVARFRKHVSPLTGVVTRLERIEADLPLNTNFHAAHNFSAPAASVNELRAGRGGGSFGKGSTAEQGEASALMEAIERYSGIFQGDEIRTKRRFVDFAPGEAIAPNDVLLFSEAQYRRSLAPMPGSRDMEAPAPLDRTAAIEWSPVWSLRDERFKHLPTSLLYFFYRGPGPRQIHADSNGCAAGNTLEEAIVQGFLELVERDAYAIWWYNRLQRPEVNLEEFDDPYVRDLRSQFAATGRRLWVLDVTSDLGVPSFVAVAHWMRDGRENVEFGSGAHFDARIALLRALTELNQFLSLGLMGGRSGDKSSLDGTTPLRLQEHPYLTPDGQAPTSPDLGSKFGRLDAREQVMACVRLARDAGLDFLVLDQTRPDIGVPVVRVIVPGLRHFYRRFAPGRLYEVPVRLGWRERMLTEDELNPIHPHT